MAGNAAQAGVVGLEFDFRTAGGTDEDFEEFCADGQNSSLALGVEGHAPFGALLGVIMHMG